MRGALEDPESRGRAYLIYGSQSLPLFYDGYRLGLDRNIAHIRSLILEDPEPAATNSPGGFSVAFVGDITKSGRDALAIAAAGGGPNEDGAVYIFTRALDPSTPGPVDVRNANSTITADELNEDGVHLRFGGLEGVEPAGDVNGDGIPDVLVTARYTESLINGTWTPVGAAAVIYGHSGGLPAHIGISEAGHIYYGDEPGTLGQPAIGHGADFFGDGRADVILSDPYYEEPLGGQLQQRGRVWLIRSTPNEPKLVDVETSASRYFVADTTLPGLFGFTWDTGDFTGDGRPDLVIGDHYLGDRELDVHAGGVYLYTNQRITH